MATNVRTELQSQAPTRAQELFRETSANYKDLIRGLLREERDVMHLKRRTDIHQRLYEQIKRVIK